MDGWLREVQRRHILYVFCSALVFRLLQTLVKFMPRPHAVSRDPWKSYKWKNLSVSVVHSLLTGTWAIFCVFQYPVMLYDLHSSFSPVSYLLVVISTGYFIQDAGDILFSGYARESWEFLLHHVLVISAFMYAVLTKHYVAGAVVALFVEVNSVFLHSRLMLKMAGVAKHSLLYTIIKFLNITTYISFRLGAQFYLTWYIVVNYSWLDHAGYFLASMVLINIMMLIYFYRLLRTDFFSKHSQSNSGRKFVQD